MPPANPSSKPAVVLLSGGLDSATVLAIAQDQGYSCHALAFDYGQRHRHELGACKHVADTLGAASHRVFSLDATAFAGSALTDDVAVPKDRDETEMTEIPATYVPARNLVFLSIALAYAESLSATDIFIGVNAIDYSGYPDCRPAFIESFAHTAKLATKLGIDGNAIRIRTPLMEMTKVQIITAGTELGVDYALTHSCYDPDANGLACGRCDSCVLRRNGFEQAGIPDPTRYA